jgi:hypothetical protein
VEGGRAPRTAILSQPKGLKPALGLCESAEGIFTRAGELEKGFICDWGDRDGGEITCAGQAGEWHNLPALGVDAVAGLRGYPGGGDDPGVRAFGGAIVVEPGVVISM